MSDKTEHLGTIQNVIDRMARNSLQIKCWSIAILTAFIALANDWVVMIAAVPLFLFCLLDARYLSLEDAFRSLYKEVCCREESQIDFLMDFSRYDKGIRGKIFTWSVLPFYLVLIVTVFVYAVINVVL